MKITIDDVRRCGHCVLGAKNWFDHYGLDFRDFLRNGIDEEPFLATGDGLARVIVDRAREQARG